MEVRGRRAGGASAGWIVPLLALGLGGCYHYTPMTVEEVAPAQDVRARVSLQQAERLEEILVGRDPRVVEGRVAEILTQGMYLDVEVASQLQGARVESYRQRVDVPFNTILELERKELSRGRTVGMVAVAVAVVGSLVAFKVIDSGGEGSQGEPPGPPENRIPISILRWP